MKFPMSKLIVSSLVIGSVFTGACGSDKKHQDRATSPDSTLSPSPLPNAPQVEVPSSGGLTSDQEFLSSDLNGLQLNEVKLDLEGDFRILQVERDSAGNYYLALVADIVRKGATASEPAFSLVKLDSAGAELWRFPTRENIAATSETPERVGSYLAGSLSHMSVSDSGEIILSGIRSFKQKIVEGTFKNFKPAQWTVGKNGADTAPAVYLGDVAFISRIDGAGSAADSPRQLSQLKLAVPLWWRPLAARRLSDGNMMLESTSGGGADGFVVQSQILSNDLSKLVSSTCFLSPAASRSVGSNSMAMVAATAAEAQVKRMDQAPGASYIAPPETQEPNFLAGLATEISKNNGRCWDALNSQMMGPQSETIRIHKPQSLAAGQMMTAKVEAMIDLMSVQTSFEEYEIDHKLVSGSSAWGLNSDGPKSEAFEQGRAQISAAGGEIILLGMSAVDMFGNSELVLSNGRNTQSKAWTMQLGSNSGRTPSSVDFAVMSNGNQSVAAWLDVHSPGETNAGNRALHLKSVGPVNGQSESKLSMSVPESTGHNSFSSVRLRNAGGGRLAVFATAGTRALASPENNARMESATLLIGFSK
jgi:hypothetical protein